MTGRSQNLRDAAAGVVKTLRQAGHEAYFAGGCVRDTLLGLRPKDFDIATGARPEQVRALFKRSKYVGEAFGVVLVYPGRRLPGLEVATFRTEWGYEDGRRPGEVQFTDAEHDAQRRDFTANELFADPLDENLQTLPAGEERVIDYVGGQDDIKRKVLRAIGDPAQRFDEDYLRMLRAVRFAARLGFEIDPSTAEAVREHALKLSKISRERIGQEVRLMLMGPGPVRAVELLHELDLDGPTLEDGGVETETQLLAKICALEVQSVNETYVLRFSAWMLESSGAAGAIDDAADYVTRHLKDELTRWRRALCLSNEERDGIRGTFALLPRLAGWDGLGVAGRKRLMADGYWQTAWALGRALGPKPFIQNVVAEATPLIQQGIAPEPYVTGDDLISMGTRPGPHIGDILEKVYDEQLELRLTSREDALAWAKDQAVRFTRDSQDTGG